MDPSNITDRRKLQLIAVLSIVLNCIIYGTVHQKIPPWIYMGQFPQKLPHIYGTLSAKMSLCIHFTVWKLAAHFCRLIAFEHRIVSRTASKRRITLSLTMHGSSQLAIYYKANI